MTMHQIGHNTAQSKDLKDRAVEIAGKLKVLAAMKRQAKNVQDEITDLFKMASSAGYDKAEFKDRIGELMMDEEQLELHFDQEKTAEQVKEMYRHALGLLGDGHDKVDFQSAVEKTLRTHGYAQDDNGGWHKVPAKAVGTVVDEINEARAAKAALDRMADEDGAEAEVEDRHGNVLPIGRKAKAKLRGKRVPLREHEDA
jgi:uncharacterized protein (UPF0335 family)